MKNTITIYLLTLICVSNIRCQEGENTKRLKHQNSFGLLLEVGGVLQNSSDIKTVFTSKTTGQIVEAVRKPSIGYGLFWEHQLNFKGQHGLLFGASALYTTFYCGVRFRNPGYYGADNTALNKEYILGDINHGFASFDFPLSYAYALETKIGTFSPSIGVKLKVVSFIPNVGRNLGDGVSVTTSNINSNGDTLYYNEHILQFGTKSVSPILMPILGLKFSRDLKNGGKLNVHLNYNFFLKSLNTVEMRLNNYGNVENDGMYEYSTSEYPIQPIYFKVNLSSFNAGLSYTLAN